MVEPPTKFSQREGAWEDLNFYTVVAHKKSGDCFQGGWEGAGRWISFCIKNKLKQKIFNDEKSL